MYIFIVEKWSFDLFFPVNSANMICRGTDISKYFRESLGLRDNDSRLIFIYSLHPFSLLYDNTKSRKLSRNRWVRTSNKDLLCTTLSAHNTMGTTCENCVLHWTAVTSELI